MHLPNRRRVKGGTGFDAEVLTAREEETGAPVVVVSYIEGEKKRRRRYHFSPDDAMEHGRHLIGAARVCFEARKQPEARRPS
jgi:hypothetical protein